MGGGCPEKQCPRGYKSAADKTYTAGGYGFLSKRPCLRRPNTRIPAATEARTNTACTLRHRRNVLPLPSAFADNPLSRPHAICRWRWRQVNSPNVKKGKSFVDDCGEFEMVCAVNVSKVVERVRR